MTDESTRQTLDRFAADVCRPLPLVSVWAHGSLAGGDHRPGRSDLDLVAVLNRRCTRTERTRLAEAHESLARELPLAVKLHCAYLPVPEPGGPSRRHLTWAHEKLVRCPVTPVARRELHTFGMVLHGPPPAGPLPRVSDAELAAFVLGDLAGYWRPALAHRKRWRRDVWVDLGMLTLARALVPLREGRLITKAEALGELLGLGAPGEVVDDIRRRRYGEPRPATPDWTIRRAELTVSFLGPAIDRVLAEHSPAA
ncbi:nucleotidyltransferase domain-containing protein [Streptomyces wuyuanensis]|uniref:nucleotidyltransferase domain-containing protein n=1 Tax=Streptomyces wuyuanensis TaxID=1196353 RepID=UPI0037A24937